MLAIIVRLAALVVCALSLGVSFAHVLEAPPRLTVWSPELWREATVFNGQFVMFGVLGGPIDGGAILLTAAVAWIAWREGRGFPPAATAAALFTLSLVVWVAVVAPMNAVMATWRPGPIPADFGGVRLRWEVGHIVMAAIKLLGFGALCLSVLLAPARRS